MSHADENIPKDGTIVLTGTQRLHESIKLIKGLSIVAALQGSEEALITSVGSNVRFAYEVVGSACVEIGFTGIRFRGVGIVHINNMDTRLLLRNTVATHFNDSLVMISVTRKNCMKRKFLVKVENSHFFNTGVVINELELNRRTLGISLFKYKRKGYVSVTNSTFNNTKGIRLNAIKTVNLTNCLFADTKLNEDVAPVSGKKHYGKTVCVCVCV